jgi:hypothetical protein
MAALFDPLEESLIVRVFHSGFPLYECITTLLGEKGRKASCYVGS